MEEDEEQLSGLIGGIYDAALDPTAWNEVLTRIIGFVDGHAHLGSIDSANAVLEKSVTRCASIDVTGNNDRGDAGMRRRMTLVVPHVRRAVLIGKLIELATKATTFADLLEGISAGTFLVDGDARIIHANAAGLRMLNAGDVLRADGGCLVAVSAEVDQTLREIFAAAACGDAAVCIKGMAVPLTSRPSQPYVAHVLPLTSRERRRTGITQASVAALFVRKAMLETLSPPEVIAKTYKLTPTELRVLLAIVEVGGVPEVAVALGIAETTIKTHLARLFEKTGASRQADLVKVVAGFSSPLAGG